MNGFRAGVARDQQLLSGRLVSSERRHIADHERCEPAPRPACHLVSMETQTWNPGGLVSAVARSSESTWGCGPGHHMGAWGPGATAVVTFNNLPVCHLGSGSNKQKNHLGICVETLFTGPFYLRRKRFVPVGRKYRRTYFSQNHPQFNIGLCLFYPFISRQYKGFLTIFLD